jgi:hypothetical protein
LPHLINVDRSRSWGWRGFHARGCDVAMLAKPRPRRISVNNKPDMRRVVVCHDVGALSAGLLA